MLLAAPSSPKTALIENGARGSLDFLSTDENQLCDWVGLFWPKPTRNRQNGGLAVR